MLAAADARSVAPVKDILLPVGRRLIEAAMREHGLTLTALGLRLGISRKHVSNVLGGKVPLSEAMADRLAEALDLDAGELLDLRHDGLVAPWWEAGTPLGIEILADPTEPIPDWSEA
jgi:transcriptional regulator with XRE-family HTH domain